MRKRNLLLQVVHGMEGLAGFPPQLLKPLDERLKTWIDHIYGFSEDEELAAAPLPGEWATLCVCAYCDAACAAANPCLFFPVQLLDKSAAQQRRQPTHTRQSCSWPRTIPVTWLWRCLRATTRWRHSSPCL